MKIPVFFVLLPLLSVITTTVGWAKSEPQIIGVSVKGAVATLRGKDFGKKCSRCEVIADFNSIKYALPVRQWADQKIVVDYSDIGKGLNSMVVVVGAEATSKPVKLKGKPVLVPTRKVGKYQNPSKNSELEIHTRNYDESIGGKGVDEFKVSSELPACGKVALVFDKADVVVGRRTRFGEAKLVVAPARSCVDCKSVKVGYYWEPTGRLDYQLHVYRRQVTGMCQDRVRK